VERKTPSVEEFLEGMRTMRREVEEALRKTNQIMKERFNKKKRNKKQENWFGLMGLNTMIDNRQRSCHSNKQIPFPLYEK